MSIVRTGQVLQKIDQKIDLSYEKYKFWRNIFGITSTLSFFINPFLMIPPLFIANYFHLKAREHSPKNKTIYNKPLHVMGKAPGAKPWDIAWGGGDFITGEGANGIYFGQDEYGLPIHLADKNGIQTHGIVFGATGAGKTILLLNIMYQQAARGGGFIFIDGKSENPTWFQVYEIATETDRQDELFLLSFRASYEARSNSWNFLLSGTSSQIGEMLSELALPTNAGQNQVFVERGKQLMFAILGAITYFRDVKKQVVTMNDISTMLKPYCLLAMIKPTLEDCLKDEKTKDYAKYWIPEDYIEKGTSNTVKDRLRSFAETIGASRDGNLSDQAARLYTEQHSYAAMQFAPMLADLANTYGKIFNTSVSDIRIDDIVRNNRMLYVLLPSLEKSNKSLEGIGKMVLAAVKMAAASTLGGKTEGDKKQMLKDVIKVRAKPPFLVIPDEFGSYAVSGFSDVLAQARSLGLGVLISAQETASFTKVGKEEAERIFGNTRYKIALNIEDKETKKYFSEQAGEINAYVKNSEQVDRFQVYNTDLKTKESYSLQKVKVLDALELSRPGAGNGVFLFFGELRRFHYAPHNPEEVDKIILNSLYPIVKLSLVGEDMKLPDVNLEEKTENPFS